MTETTMAHDRFHPAQMEALCAPHSDGDELHCRGCHDRAHTMFHEEMNRVTGHEIDEADARFDPEWTDFLDRWHALNGCPWISEGAT